MKTAIKFLKPSVLGAIATGLVLGISGCSDSDDNDDMVTMVDYEINVVNLTHSQPLSPVAVLAHGNDFTGWQIGAESSAELEVMAEGGDNTDFSAQSGVDTSASGAGVLLPGVTESIGITLNNAESMLTIATMLVNTNDAFAGVTGIDLSTLSMGDSQTLYLPVYDAGTEFNSELAGTIPGPADGGEGYNAARDDVNYVARHPGVVSNQDGYSDSVLLGVHKFDGPIAKVTISRLN